MRKHLYLFVCATKNMLSLTPMETPVKKILIVEDEFALSDTLKEVLLIEGFIVFVAKDGEEGLDLALREQPDLILLDIILPRMDGLAMLKRLRADERGKDVKVILLTNLSGTKEVAEAVELGAYEFLVKSDWKLDDVVAMVKKELKA